MGLPTSVTLLASAARTTSSQTAALVGFGSIDEGEFQLNVTAASGTTPTLDVVIEGTVDGANWYPIVTFAQQTATNVVQQAATGIIGDQLRVRWTVGGTTPSFTFAVTGVVES